MKRWKFNLSRNLNFIQERLNKIYNITNKEKWKEIDYTYYLCRPISFNPCFSISAIVSSHLSTFISVIIFTFYSQHSIARNVNLYFSSLICFHIQRDTERTFKIRNICDKFYALLSTLSVAAREGDQRVLANSRFPAHRSRRPWKRPINSPCRDFGFQYIQSVKLSINTNG